MQIQLKDFIAIYSSVISRNVKGIYLYCGLQLLMIIQQNLQPLLSIQHLSFLFPLKITPIKAYLFNILIFKCSMLHLYKLLIQKEINHIDIQNAIVIIPTLSNIFPYHYFRERISCEHK